MSGAQQKFFLYSLPPYMLRLLHLHIQCWNGTFTKAKELDMSLLTKVHIYSMLLFGIGLPAGFDKYTKKCISHCLIIQNIVLPWIRTSLVIHLFFCLPQSWNPLIFNYLCSLLFSGLLHLGMIPYVAFHSYFFQFIMCI